MNSIIYPPSSLPLLQRRFEFEWLLRIFQLRKPRRVLELGAASGGSVWGWAHNCLPSSVIVAVDQYHESYDNRVAFPQWEHEGNCRIVAIKGFTENPKTIEEIRAHAPFDWLFIDADHHYKAALRDWDNYMPMVSSGGIIAFHDITPNGKADIQVSQLWREIQRDHWPTLSIQEDISSDTCGIGLVFKP